MVSRRKADDATSVVRGIMAGAVAGVVASAVMNQFQKLAGKLISDRERSHGAQSQQDGTPGHGVGKYLDERGLDEPDDTAPARLANAASVAVSGDKLSEGEKEKAGTLLHYAYGTSMAVAYGAAAELVPSVTAGRGLAYGAAVWLGADEVVTPFLGLSKGAVEYPVSVHAYALASHLVYGLTAEAVRNTVRNMI